MPSTSETMTASNFIADYYKVVHPIVEISPDYLMHHGTKGQKWHNRRYQYEDGSLTPLGREHYGVGPAREKIGKALSSAGTAIRRAVRPTDEELLEKYDKLQAKQARKSLKNEIRGLEGKKKKIKDMTDQEIIDEINRHRNEATLKALQRDANKSEARKMIEKAAKDGVSQALSSTVRDAASKVGERFTNKLDTKEKKLAREAQAVRDQKAIDDAKKPKSEADKIREEAEMRKNSKAAYEAKLQEEALKGNADAKQKLSDFKNASKGDFKRDDSFVDLDEDASSYTAPKSKKKHDDSNVSDVSRKGNVYEADAEEYVEDVPTSGSKKQSSNTKFVDLDEGDTYEPPGKSSTEDFMRSWMSKDVDSTVEDVNPDASDYIYDQGNTKCPPDDER